ncbi:NAD(P)-binding protein [Lepidopterella palustris CBS 459.81]|uniref:NAD(P)-binding protein n=1 Tax=Lepidopterella palustris CBS 459.81 TaxID=1314670 RepID=A0A8E2EI57_9PEZI|nr:NAD(P)-binding protein [Lepidopterella palustris CBS 459.81]
MVRVAIAGGTGGLGRAVVEAILATEKHDVFVLSRSLDAKAFTDNPKVTILAIDYDSPSSIAAVLKSNNIDTVISTMSIFTEAQAQAQLNLIEGAVQSGTVRRFAPSEFGIDYVEAKRQGFALPSEQLVDYKVQAVEKLEASPLNFTRFIVGFFLDYSGYPHFKTYLPHMAIVLDIPNAVAAIPGDGEVPVVFTLTRDVGKFVAASLDLEKWEPKSVIVGDRLTLNQLLKYAEEARGKKFDVHYDDIAKLKSHHVTELPTNVPRYAFFPKEMMEGMATGWFDFKGETLNEKLPQVKTTSARELLQECWKGK